MINGLYIFMTRYRPMGPNTLKILPQEGTRIHCVLVSEIYIYRFNQTTTLCVCIVYYIYPYVIYRQHIFTYHIHNGFFVIVVPTMINMRIVITVKHDAIIMMITF